MISSQASMVDQTIRFLEDLGHQDTAWQLQAYRWNRNQHVAITSEELRRWPCRKVTDDLQACLLARSDRVTETRKLLNFWEQLQVT
jgi:hypothetical protein